MRKLTDGNWRESADENEDDDEGVSEDMEMEVKVSKPGRYYKDQVSPFCPCFRCKSYHRFEVC